jgi:hypothetical protein
MGLTPFSPSLRADSAVTNAAPQAATAPAQKPAANTAAVPRPPDTFNRYGKIWAPSDDVTHPIKLNVQFPGVGEMKIPSQEELQVRDKLEQLATLSDADIHKQLDQWPPYSKMKLGDQGQLLERIQAFRDLRTRVALQKAHDMGLLTLTNDQKVRFEKEYWDKRLQMDHDLAKPFEPVFRARAQKLQDDLYREFAPVPLAKNNPPAAPQLKDTTTGQQPAAQPH